MLMKHALPVGRTSWPRNRTSTLETVCSASLAEADVVLGNFTGPAEGSRPETGGGVRVGANLQSCTAQHAEAPERVTRWVTVGLWAPYECSQRV